MKAKCSSCNLKKTKHSEELKRDFETRLNKIEGQVRGVKKMISDSIYCDDILTQISAIQSAISAVAQNLLATHMKTCVVDKIRNGELEVIDEVMKTVKRMTKSR